MTERVACNRKKLLPLAVVWIVTAMPVALAQTDAGPAAAPVSAPAFEVVSIKPSAQGAVGHGQGVTPTQFFVRDMPLEAVLWVLYITPGMAPENLLRNAPGWVMDDRYSITAKFDEATVAAWKGLNPQQLSDHAKPLIEAMLADRFKLAVHTEPAEVQGYAVVVSKRGARLKQSDMSAPAPTCGQPLPGGGCSRGMSQDGAPAMTYSHTSIASMLAELMITMNLPLVDQTGLTGRYDFVLPKRQTMPVADGASDAPEPDGLFWDLSALGLELKPIKMPTVRVVIDHIERPTEN